MHFRGEYQCQDRRQILCTIRLEGQRLCENTAAISFILSPASGESRIPDTVSMLYGGNELKTRSVGHYFVLYGVARIPNTSY